MQVFISYLTNIILFISLYFTCFWILILFNSQENKYKKKIKYPNVSIIIPAFNEELGIEKTIKSILNLKYIGKIKIYVVNDASSDNTIKIINKYKKKIIIIDKKKNAGKAAAINSALKLVDTEFITIIDADSQINKNSLQNAIKLFFGENGDEIGAVISKMKPLNESKNILERIQLIEYMMVGLIRNLSSAIGLLHLTPGVLSVYRTKIIKKLKGFDENNLTEDFEIGVRIRKSGYLIAYSQESLVYTNTPNVFKIFLSQRIRWSRGFIQTHKKHKEIFFNKKYGLFGIYQFPMNILGPIIYFAAIFAISFKVYTKLYEFIFKLINTPDVINWFQFDSLYDMYLTINPQIDFIIIFSFLGVLFLFYCVIKFYDYNFFKKNTFKKIWAFIIYILIYNYIYIYVWIISLKKEFKKEDYNWGTK